MVEEYLEEELVVVALLENDDDDEREEEIIFAGERTRIVKTGIFYGVSFQKEDQKRIKKRKRKKNKTERVYLNPNCHKTLNFFSCVFLPLLCCVGTTLIKKKARETRNTRRIE